MILRKSDKILLSCKPDFQNYYLPVKLKISVHLNCCSVLYCALATLPCPGPPSQGFTLNGKKESQGRNKNKGKLLRLEFISEGVQNYFSTTTKIEIRT